MASDIELLEAWQAGDAHAGERLFERYYDNIYNFFRYKLEEDVVDLVQQTFFALIEGVSRVRSAHSFRSYLFAIAHNLLRQHLRERYRRDQRVLDLEQVSAAQLAPGPSSAFAQNEEKRLLLEGLRGIPIELQVLLELRYWEQLKTVEIAEVLGIPHPTVRGRLRRAHELLEKRLNELAESSRAWNQTFSDLQVWAKNCRERLDQPLPDD